VRKCSTTALTVLLAFGLTMNLAIAEDRAKKQPADVQMSGMRSMVATGNVKVVQNERMAVAGQALFDNVNRTITLTDNPRVWQGSDVAQADKIVIYLDENRTEFTGKEGGPITVMINPNKPKNNEGDKDESPASLRLDGDQPIQVTAKKSTGKNLPTGKELIFEGNVRVRQGQVTLTCDKLVMTFDEEKSGA
jgi:lipopolysaccharide export system protein LptA